MPLRIQNSDRGWIDSASSTAPPKSTAVTCVRTHVSIRGSAITQFASATTMVSVEFESQNNVEYS